MLTRTKKVFGFLVLLSIGLNAQAGHLFTQAALNTPVVLSAGFGVTIPQVSLEGSSSQADIYLCDFGSGDVMRVTMPGFTMDLAFDSLPAGWSYDANAGLCDPLNPDAGDGLDGFGSAQATAMEALNIPVPFNWRIDAVAGSFTLQGFRLNLSNGKINGTGAATVNQSGVTPTGAANVPIFQPIHMVLLVLGLIGIAGVWQRMSRQH